MAFTIDPKLYAARKFSPIVEFDWDMDKSGYPKGDPILGPFDADNLGKEGLICIRFQGKGNAGSLVSFSIAPHPFTAQNNDHGEYISSITEAKGDFSHNAGTGKASLNAQVIAGGGTPPRGQIGIFGGTWYYINVAHVPNTPQEGGLRVTPSGNMV